MKRKEGGRGGRGKGILSVRDRRFCVFCDVRYRNLCVATYLKSNEAINPWNVCKETSEWRVLFERFSFSSLCFADVREHDGWSREGCCLLVCREKSFMHGVFANLLYHKKIRNTSLYYHRERTEGRRGEGRSSSEKMSQNRLRDDTYR